MRVLLLNQTFYPDQAATSQQTLDLALFLTERGHQVTVIAGQRSYDNPKRKLQAREIYRGIEIRRVRSTGFGKRGFLLRVIDGLTFELSLLLKLMIIPTQDYVVSFTSPPLIGLFGALFCMFRGGRSVQWLMDVNPDAAIVVGYLRRGSFIARTLSAIFAFSLRRSHHIVVLDRWMKERILIHGADPDRISIIPPWPVHEVEPVPPAELGVKFRKEHGIHEKFVVLYSGNHSIVHPLNTLLDAAALMRENEKVVFLFIGGGLRVADVTNFVRKNNLKNVLQLPHQPRGALRDSLSSANLHVVVMGEAVSGLVHTSKIYGVLGTGKPYVFIGPRRSHVVDLLQECPYGYHVEPGRPANLVNVIERASKLTREELAVFSRENIRFVTERYAAHKSMEIFSVEVLQDFVRKQAKTAVQF